MEPFSARPSSAELAAEIGHCQRDLGRPEKAIEYASRALASASGDYLRSDFFVAMVLADAHRGGAEKVAGRHR